MPLKNPPIYLAYWKSHKLFDIFCPPLYSGYTIWQLFLYILYKESNGWKSLNLTVKRIRLITICWSLCFKVKKILFFKPKTGWNWRSCLCALNKGWGSGSGFWSYPKRILNKRSDPDTQPCSQCPKLLVTIFRNLVKSRNKVRFGLAFTIDKRYYIHV